MSRGTFSPSALSHSERMDRPGSRRGRLAQIASIVCVCALLVPHGVTAQALAMHRPVHAGEVTGLELSLEGAREAVRGGHIRWLTTVHEVVGLSDLQPAAHARVRVLSSLQRERAMSEATTDDVGRAQVGFDVPVDAPSSFHVIVEATSPRGVRRQFDLDVATRPTLALTLEIDRPSVRPGDDVNVWGRVVSNVTHRPVPNLDVAFDLLDPLGRPAEARRTLHTDAGGGFAQRLRLPAGTFGSFTVLTTAGEEAMATTARVSVATQLPTTPAMIVLASAAQPVVHPGEPVPVTVIVRTGDGRPVRDAVITTPLIPTVPNGREPFSVRTDARGRAGFSFAAPSTSTYSDVAIPVHATRVGVGSADTSARVRVARIGLFGAVSVEGGALVPDLPGRLYVRVVRADGAPAGSGVQVHVAGPRFAANLAGTTGDDGVAVIDTTLHPPARTHRPPPATTDEGDDESEDASQDPCGGETATSAHIELSAGTQHGLVEGCLPVDPDATVRVRVQGSPRVAAGSTVHVELVRARAVAQLPIEVAIVGREGDTLVPLTAVRAAPGARTLDVPLPPEVRGPVVVRARPLFGSVGEPIRGGVTLVFVTQGSPFTLALRAESDARGLTITSHPAPGSSPTGTEGTVVVLPRADGEALLNRIRAREGATPLGDLRVDVGEASDALIAGALAAMAHVDDAAPAVLRAGALVSIPAPDEPASRGTLRDPWRARARFVEGRLALVFRQIEQHVASQLPRGRDNVAVRDAGGRWSFNREIFDAILASGENDTTAGPRALGGDPLSIPVLQRLDPAFTYDNVARRITRRRLFMILLALRHFVNERSLDLRWSWRGDPTTWLHSLVDEGIAYDSAGESLQQTEMVDGWGTPFALRPARGRRPRFGFVAPVPGFELVSAGPDLRFGTGDDMVDPFARVLPANGAYGRAVDEDGLLARLHGVELGRATIARLATVFEVEASGDDGSGDESTHETARWEDIPSHIEADPHALDLLRPSIFARADVSPLAALAPSGATHLPLHVDDEPRTYAAVVDGWSASGDPASAITTFSAGRPVLVDLPLAPEPDEEHPTLPRIVVGEPIHVGVSITNLGEVTQTFAIASVGDGPIAAESPTSVTVPAGQLAVVDVTVHATRIGQGALRFDVRDVQGAVLREVRAPMLADDGRLPLRDDGAGLARAGDRGGVTLAVRIPSDRDDVQTRLVLETATAIADDPELARVRHYDPALIAWAYTLASREVPGPLAAALLQAQEPGGRVSRVPASRGQGGIVLGGAPSISTACALVVWSAAGEDDVAAAQARTNAARVLPTLRGSIDDPTASAGSMREAAALLTAIATGAQGADSEESSSDPITVLTENLRTELRSAQRNFAAQPTLLARAAAALLLADPSDGRGIALFELARHAVVHQGDRARVRGGDGHRSQVEELTGTAALAIAAQQRGEIALAQQLARTLGSEAHALMRPGGEPTFWLLATAGYGVFGLDAPDAVIVHANGSSRRIALTGGRAMLPFDAHAGETAAAAIEVPGNDAGAQVLGRIEVRSHRRYVARTDSPLTLELQGDPGYAGEVAALELSVRNRGTTRIGRSVVELQLPAGSGFGETERQALASRPGVSSVEVRDGGMVRVVLDPLEGAEARILPLAVRWLARGRVSGFAATAYREDEPAQLSVLAPRVVDLRDRPAE